MLITAFARATDLSVDTVRYYVRRGLLRPRQGSKGGRNPYQIFGEEDVRVAEWIRLGQALGLSLSEIAALLEEERSGRIDDARGIAILTEHRERMAARAAELARLIAYLDAKIAWLNAGGRGASPRLVSTQAAA